jgi:hypothetical protein
MEFGEHLQSDDYQQQTGDDFHTKELGVFYYKKIKYIYMCVCVGVCVRVWILWKEITGTIPEISMCCWWKRK